LPIPIAKSLLPGTVKLLRFTFGNLNEVPPGKVLCAVEILGGVDPFAVIVRAAGLLSTSAAPFKSRTTLAK